MSLINNKSYEPRPKLLDTQNIFCQLDQKVITNALYAMIADKIFC